MEFLRAQLHGEFQSVENFNSVGEGRGGGGGGGLRFCREYMMNFSRAGEIGIT